MKLGRIIAACLTLTAAPLFAHHSFAAEFDAHRPIRLNGTILRYAWQNPHVMILMNVEGVRWEIEAASPNAMSSRGFTKSTLVEGARVTIDAFEARSGEHRAMGRDVILPDGRKLFILSSESALRGVQ